MPDMGRERMTPEILHMLALAANPETSAAGGFTEDGEFKFNAFKKPKEAKSEGETAQPAAEAKPAATPQQPASPFAGFAPALAALAAGGGGGVSAATLTGLTPEQITGLLNVESEKQRLQQGTIGQLLELPYRQALTAKAMRGEVPLSLQVDAIKALIAQREREPARPLTLEEKKELKREPGAPPAYPQGDWWRSPAGDIKWYDKGEDIPKDWERVPSREQVPKAETVYGKTISIKGLDTLRTYTHDEETGKPLDVPDTTGISALNETLKKEGKEAVAITLPSLERKRLGLDWLKKDLPGQTIYVIVGEDASPTAAEVKNALVSAYGYTPEEADAVIKLKRGR